MVLLSGILGVVDRWSAYWASSFSLGSYGQGIIFCCAVGALLALTVLPTELYSTFGIEAKFGFNKTTVGLYLSDKLKGLRLRFANRRALFAGGIVVDGYHGAGLVALGFCLYLGISTVDDRDFPNLYCAVVQQVRAAQRRRAAPADFSFGAADRLQDQRHLLDGRLQALGPLQRLFYRHR